MTGELTPAPEATETDAGAAPAAGAHDWRYHLMEDIGHPILDHVDKLLAELRNHLLLQLREVEDRLARDIATLALNDETLGADIEALFNSDRTARPAIRRLKPRVHHNER